MTTTAADAPEMGVVALYSRITRRIEELGQARVDQLDVTALRLALHALELADAPSWRPSA